MSAKVSNRFQVKALIRFLAGTSLASLAVLSSNLHPAKAQFNILNGGKTVKVWGTGQNVNAGNPLAANTSTVESYWKLIAFPNDYVGVPLADLTFPGNLYLPSRINDIWYAGPSNPCPSSYTQPVTNTVFCESPAVSLAALNGDTDTYRWLTYANYTDISGSQISAKDSNGNTYAITDTDATLARSYFRGSGDNIGNQANITTPALSGPTPQGYRYILQTKFTPSLTDVYDFTSYATADNFIEIYLGGTVSDANTTMPGITGGTFLGKLAANNTGGLFQNLATITTAGVPLTAGQEYELNYVITDNFNTTQQTFGSTGALVATTLFTIPTVPAPLPLLGAAAFFQRSRQIRRRLLSRQPGKN